MHTGHPSQQQGYTPSSTKKLLTTKYFKNHKGDQFTLSIPTENSKKKSWNLTINIQQVHKTQKSLQHFKLILNQWLNSCLPDWLQRINFWHCLLNKQACLTCDCFYQHSCELHKNFLAFIFLSFQCSLTEERWIQVADRKQVLHKSTTALKTVIPLIKVVREVNFKLGIN